MLCGEGVVAYGYTLQRLVNVMEEESLWKKKKKKKKTALNNISSYNRTNKQ